MPSYGKVCGQCLAMEGHEASAGLKIFGKALPLVTALTVDVERCSSSLCVAVRSERPRG